MFTKSFALAVIFVAMILYHVNGESIPCSNREHSPLCFCRSTFRRSILTDLFLSKISLSQCSMSNSTNQCRHGRLSQSAMHITQLTPNLVNYSHCLENVNCLQTLHTVQRCYQCQIMPSSLFTENTSYVISTTSTKLPTNSCFYICEHDHSCGFLCFDRRMTLTINCKICRGQRRNVTCRCLKVKKTQSCSRSTTETATPRWMQKRGFPAAGILALIVLITVLLIIVIKLISRQWDVLAGRSTKSNRRSTTTMTTYRSRQASPSTLISFPNTPVIPSAPSSRHIVAANTMVELLNEKSRKYVVDIHEPTDRNDLNVFILKDTAKLDAIVKDINNIEDEAEEDQI